MTLEVIDLAQYVLNNQFVRKRTREGWACGKIEGRKVEKPTPRFSKIWVSLLCGFPIRFAITNPSKLGNTECSDSVLLGSADIHLAIEEVL